MDSNEKENNKEKLARYSFFLLIIALASIILSFIIGLFLEILFLSLIVPIILNVLAIILATGALKTKERKLAIKCIIIGFLFIIIYGYFWTSTTKSAIMASNMDSKKPIIYLYPEEETNVSVELPEDDRLLVSYPKYEESWKVLAKENGDLVDLETGRNLYSLYYENKNVVDFKVEKEGFVVKGEDTAKFLEEKLEILGLNEREAEEFIIYWLPKLEENKYNYIRFASVEEIEENMPLEISPKPDTTIRVLMTYKGLDRKIEVEEQKLETPKREGFVAVEWGGTEIK